MPSVHWRIVRPDHKEDVGPLHADGWFSELGYGVTPPSCTRIKVWLSLFNQPGENGLRYVKQSHKADWKYEGEFRDGIVKPKILDEPDASDVTPFNISGGGVVIFGDRLLHGGFVGGTDTRVSIEFTVFAKH